VLCLKIVFIGREKAMSFVPMGSDYVLLKKRSHWTEENFVCWLQKITLFVRRNVLLGQEKGIPFNARRSDSVRLKKVFSLDRHLEKEISLVARISKRFHWTGECMILVRRKW
jgi:hypothetical protein